MVQSSHRRKDLTRHVLAVTVCFALLLSTLTLGARSSAARPGAQDQSPALRPVTGPPGADLPNLDAVRRRP